MGRKMNVQSAAVLDFNSRGQTNDMSVEEPSWLERRLYELGVYDMAPSTNRPSGFFVNWTTVTSLIIVVSAIAGLWYFTWQTAEQRGMERGRAEAEREQSQKEMDKMKGEMRLMEEKLKQIGQQ